ncbi:MAG TPA: tyrosinase family protein, partial [Candidatus Thermoplasmatota archaeon]|nr:tyrosinase family protein [Candidatus Thermoplasmatota archaeon]
PEDRYGIIFFEWHRHFLQKYEAWRAENGHPPLEPWDPATPMPPSLAYPYPERACSDGRVEDPRVPLPTWATVAGGEEADPLFGHTRLCAFRDLNELGKSVAFEYHWQFHAGIQGDMVGGRGPLDPAFWAGHQFINRLMDAWWEACDAAPRGGAALGAGVDEARAVPLPGLVAFAALAASALALRRR